LRESYLSDAIDRSLVRRALVVKLRHFGDVLLTSPVFTTLADAIPGIQVDALVYGETAAVLEGHPDISRIYRIDRHWKQQGLRVQWQQERALLQALRGRHYDLVIHLTEHARGARLVRRLKPRYAVARGYRGKRGAWWRNSFTHLYDVPQRPRHTVEIHLDALRRLGIYPLPEQRRLVLRPAAEAQDSVRQKLREQGLDSERYLLLHPTSRWMFKGWSRQGFADVITLLQRAGYRLVLTSGPAAAELETVASIIGLLEDRNLVNLAGQLDLRELAAVIGDAACFVGLDSLPMHMAAAMQTPTVALFGPSDELTWGPWQVAHRLLTTGYPCRPCNLDGCGNGKISDCLMAIDPAAVVAAVTSLCDSAADATLSPRS
jgi:heptosyltransferase-3